MAVTVQEKRAAFWALHKQGCFIMPNPWDVGSAIYLQQLGFKALATTSSGHAWSHGRHDGGMARDAVLQHLQAMVAATSLPVNADFENGFGANPQDVNDSVRLAVATGVAGLSIEDATHDCASPQYDISHAIERLDAARAAIDQSGTNTLLVGRAENFILGNPDLDDTIRRLQAYSQAGADCLYAPGIHTREQITAVVQAVAPKPVNLLVGRPIGLDLREIAALGVRRISVGGALARVAWAGFQGAARMLQEGSFDALEHAASHPQLDAIFRA